ncbi:hypothetical protein [Enterobacter hormaechei]|uniref:hypothetical protein n=1 Tax=Enterobacter hormaechei TaxID=158836 RepID=UPI003C2BD989
MYYNAIELLIDTELYDDFNVSVDYRNLPDDIFFEQLKAYCRKAEFLLSRDIGLMEWESPFNLYLPNRNNTDYFYKSLLSMDSIIINDDIFECFVYLKDYDYSRRIVNATVNPFERTKSKVSSFICFLKKNKALLSNGSIYTSPSKVLDYESAKKRTLLVNSTNESQMLSGVSKKTINIYKKSILVNPVERVGEDEDGIYIKRLPPKSISGELNVEIKGCSEPYINGYMYAQAETYIDPHGREQVNYDTRKFTIPSSRLKFDNWVGGVINRTIKEHLAVINLNLSFASDINAAIAYPCDFTNRILNSMNSSGGEKRRMLSVSTPLLHNITPDLIAEIKNDYGESFDAYKKTLLEAASRMQFANNSRQIEAIEKDFKTRVYDEGVREVQKSLKKLKTKSLGEVCIESGLASLGFIDSKVSLLSVLTAGVGFYRTAKNLTEEYSQIKKNPSYFILKTITK